MLFLARRRGAPNRTIAPETGQIPSYVLVDLSFHVGVQGPKLAGLHKFSTLFRAGGDTSIILPARHSSGDAHVFDFKWLNLLFEFLGPVGDDPDGRRAGPFQG